jgi:hypothetical protein
MSYYAEKRRASLDMNGQPLTVDTLSIGSETTAAGLTFTPAAGGSNVAEVAIRVVDAAGDLLAGAWVLDVWLSDAASGAGLTATTASGTVQAKSASGVDLQAVTAKKHLSVQTLATGIYTLDITATDKTGFRVCGTVPSTGKTAVSAALVTANYG